MQKEEKNMGEYKSYFRTLFSTVVNFISYLLIRLIYFWGKILCEQTAV